MTSSTSRSSRSSRSAACFKVWQSAPILIVSASSLKLARLVKRLGISDRINHLYHFCLGPWIRQASVECFDFPSLEAVRERLLGFAGYYEGIAQSFEWKFTRKDLVVTESL